MSDTKRFFKALFKRKIVAVALVVIVFFLLCAIASPLIATHDPYEQDLFGILKGPSAEHWLGTDNLGRDVYSRIIYGSRIAFIVGIFAVIISGVLGTALGLAAGYFGGWVDSVISRLVEAMMAIPPIVLALALVAIFGRSLPMLTVVMGVSSVPAFARMMRGQVLTVRDLDYVAASRIRGNSNFVTMVKHILPNCMSPMIIVMTQSIGGTILAEAGLSFLGAGVLPPAASWGAMVSDGYTYLSRCPSFALAPGVAVILLVLAFNIFGDGIRDALDPRLRGTR